MDVVHGDGGRPQPTKTPTTERPGTNVNPSKHTRRLWRNIWEIVTSVTMKLMTKPERVLSRPGQDRDCGTL